MSWLFTSGGQSTGTSASVLSVNIQGWFRLDWVNLAVQGILKSLQSVSCFGVFGSFALFIYFYFTNKWNHTVFVFLFLISHQVHLCRHKRQGFTLYYYWVILHCVCVCVGTCIYLTYTKHFLYLVIFGGYLGCLYILGIVNSSTINIGVCVSFCIVLLLYSGKCLELLERLISLFLNFLGTSIIFSIVTGLIDTFTNSTWGFVLNVY